MRQPAKIKLWLSGEKMFRWIQDAPNQDSYVRRLTIWLAQTGKIHAPKIAEILGVSTQAVWLWIRQYNTSGPVGLDRNGRGGRRWAFMTEKQEIELLKPFIRQTRDGYRLSAHQIKAALEQKLGKKLSIAYVYRLLARHHWKQVTAAPPPSPASQVLTGDFKKIARPWVRKT